ncbi:RES domain-containing protein [Tenacibaculum finnmarkense genomovar ulcerans]|uniref:RES domain-containing protein n=1 Tax=Tenacibaculum finnmarkense TaxID=2781243 RepID=UPI00187B7878|nr:RES domain-containing protein [Tenacibaculum finnmarkense]MBE7633584.1 RES domain-containing protein [Tenacibaculum finnmarkense genomovar ulcerans]MBE7687153.1 RES domain-containing protein [Tenacibaculum finnmarkense genomovar ulcerans]MCD8429498.1 RES domain-containing protein [Tenacibaculum finnmarkense genomovar ulcerans]MCD8431912.1 RES domain-containing protein [Tenacibaculum finnmarkense genomovar ulcerans]MCD8444452.1 RES domain-containing protein [Tenacibaculum finnmarkense genomo
MTNIIQSNKEKGDCSFCNTENTNVYLANKLLDFFKNIFNLYKVDENSSTSLWDSINRDFEVIENNCISNSEKLFKAIAKNEYTDFSHLFENNVSRESKDLLDTKSNEVQSIWDRFKAEIKHENRFHISSENLIDLNTLKTFFDSDSFIKIIKKGRCFYRCRISNKEGFSNDKMGNPPNEFATSGRANPKGISYLYLGSRIETTFYESRASLFDYASVAEFRVKEDIKILDLRNPEYDIIRWSEEDIIDMFLTYANFIKTLQEEISLPIRKQDKDLDYIPTQYISEYIKSLGFDGIEYQSSLDKDGYNLAIFNPDKFECIATKVYDIHNIKLEYSEVKLKP